MDDYFTDDHSIVVKSSVDFCYRMVDIPNSCPVAISSLESSKWHKAMQEEINSLKENNTFELTHLPEGRHAEGWGRWVFTVKSSPNCDDQVKACYVAKGYSQVQNLDYYETFRLL